MAASWLMKLCKLRAVYTFRRYALAQMESFSWLHPRIVSSGYVLVLAPFTTVLQFLFSNQDTECIAVFGALGLGYRQEENQRHVPRTHLPGVPFLGRVFVGREAGHLCVVRWRNEGLGHN